MKSTVAAVPMERDQSGAASAPEGQEVWPGPYTDPLGVRLRDEVVAELEAMALFLLSDGRLMGQDAADGLSRLERHAEMPLGELIALHGHLARAVAPAKPRSILSLRQGQATAPALGFLGPTQGVRRLTCASLFFALAFFLISLSGEINVEAMSKSIYELDGLPLAIKLGLIVSAAGLGATFATLFSVWEDLRNHRYDPLAESASWMQVALGVVAGLMLAEIIGGEQVLTAAGDRTSAVSSMSEPLLALLGGFSAGVIHMILNSIVNALRRAFGHGREDQAPPELLQRAYAQISSDEAAARETTPGRRTTPPAARTTERAAQEPEPRGE